MKRILLSATALSFALTASAFAADLPSHKAPAYIPPPPPPPLWTGFYGGLNAGGVFSGSDTVTTLTGNVFTNSPTIIPGSGPASALATSGVNNASTSGFIGGGQAGYNYQFGGIGIGSGVVVGLETDIQGISSTSGGNKNFVGAATVPGAGGDFWLGVGQTSKSIDYVGTVRGRLGLLATPTLLIYGTGGLAYGGVNLNSGVFAAGVNNGGPGFAASSAFGGTGAYSDTRVGWTAGGGIEWLFLPNWSAKVEYLYYDLGSVALNYVSVRPVPVAPGGIGIINATQTSARFNGNIIRAGVNYHFNWAAPAPVLAKY